MTKRWNFVRRPLLVICAGLLLQSCVSAPPEPARAAVAAPGAASSTISRQLLADCLRDSPKVAATVGPNAVAAFNSGATGSFAARMKKSPPNISVFADRIRAYSLDYEYASLLGKNRFQRVCYYDQADGRLRYLTSVTFDSVGSVQKTQLVGAVVDAYEVMSGKSLSFAERTAAVLSVPNY